MEFLGWCALKYHVQRGEINLGYRIMQKHWDDDYATEAAFASIRYGFEKLNLHTIIGKDVKANKASIHVLKKCG